jgi:hypothetical protein
VSRNKNNNREEILGFLGVGLDDSEGHQRLTQTEEFLLVGGSAETHEKMQDTAIRFNESLKKKGKTLRETSKEEALDLLRDSLDC